MENYMKKQKESPFIKNQYYPGKLLHASDFVREQEYGSRKLAFANRKLHGSGIMDGFGVKKGQAGEWYVTAGSAIDPEGRFLVLPQDTKIDFERLEGLQKENGASFVLGVRYAEQVLEREHSIFEGKETYQAARIAEGVAFGAYSVDEWRRLKAETGRYEEKLTEERVLYENGEIRLLLKLPRLVPTDSIFRVRIQAVAVGGAVSIGWRGTAKLQGAFFAESGKDSLVLEKPPMVFSGMLEEGWDICTEEGRNVPVLFELSQLELLREGAVFARGQTVQVSVETAASYRIAAEKYLWDEDTAGRSWDVLQERNLSRDGWEESSQGGSREERNLSKGGWEESEQSGNHQPKRNPSRDEWGESGQGENRWEERNPNKARWEISGQGEKSWQESTQNEVWRTESESSWLPLARFQMAVSPDGTRHFSVIPDHAVRFYTIHPQEEEILRRTVEENGIVDIRWRSLLKNTQPFTPPFPPPVPQPVSPLPAPTPVPQPVSPLPAPPPVPQPISPSPLPYPPEPFAGMFAEEWGKHICRGVTVIPVPKRYKKGQVLLSEEISHGFAGEEVSVWYGRLRETEGHVYWERDKKSFFVIQGDEGLFPEQKGGWEIEKQALRQNVAEGTFQIALTLAKGKRRNRIREVAVSWIAVRSI